MNSLTLHTKIKLSHFLLVSGNGRNVGKTTLACKIITQLSKSTPVSGIKISSHFHSYSEDEVVKKSDSFVILEEKKHNSKDSSLMLQAGAHRVYFVMAAKQNLEDALSQLLKLIPNEAVVCESGGLHEHVSPGLFLFVNKKNKAIEKVHLLKQEPIIVENDGENFNMNIKDICFTNKRIQLRP
ncbi:hypothetical protein [Maribellus mangrovi]|uniref:hypothetical protein n=1 Tax=Maribellus mangrovi TaxID=3133146 RepID=UPI0030EC3867